MAMTGATSRPPTEERANRLRTFADRLAAMGMYAAGGFAVLVVVAIGSVLLTKSWPVLTARPLVDVLFSSVWKPSRGQFGYYAFIVGTVQVTVLAMAISVPISLLAAVYLAEYAGRRVRAVAKPLLDLLAGIPSVVIGLFGWLAVVPAVAAWRSDTVSSPPVCACSPRPSCWRSWSSRSPSRCARRCCGRCRRGAGGVVVRRRDALADGQARAAAGRLPGLTAAIILGFSRLRRDHGRADGGGQRPPGRPLRVRSGLHASPLIANTYGEVASIPLQESAADAGGAVADGRRDRLQPPGAVFIRRINTIVGATR